MKYKVGDRVKITTWKQIPLQADIDLENLSPKRVITIRKIEEENYLEKIYWGKEVHWWFYELRIEGLFVPEIFEPIETRFEILDLRSKNV